MPETVPVLLLRVAAAWLVPGLGLLALPAGPGGPLGALPLHMALAVEARLPGEAAVAGTATVEEVERAGHTVYGLLLAFAGPVDLPQGTEIWQRAGSLDAR